MERNAEDMMKAYVEPREVSLMEKEATNLRDRLLIRVLFHLGCRITEALNLEVKHINFTDGTLTIQHLKAKVKLFCPQCRVGISRSHTFCPGCGIKVEKAVAEEREHQRMRTLPVDKETLEMLKKYMRREGPITQNGRQLLFGINRHRGWQVVKECADRAGVGKLVNPATSKLHNTSPHRLRDAFAVMAVQRDDSTDSIRMLQEQLGHASIGTTIRYRKVAGRELREWYQKLWEEKNGG